jgi:DNA-binding response OmpR family regulator
LTGTRAEQPFPEVGNTVSKTARTLRGPTPANIDQSPARWGSLSPLILDAHERRIRGFEMPPLLSGEFALLTYLGARPCIWQSSYRLSIQVYRRDDPGARQLVWKYASTLRQKLARAAPDLIEHCRRRGYCCRAPVRLVAEDSLPELQQDACASST